MQLQQYKLVKLSEDIRRPIVIQTNKNTRKHFNMPTCEDYSNRTTDEIFEENVKFSSLFDDDYSDEDI